jgi:hypothetical protein
MHAHSSVFARVVFLAFLLLCTAPAGVGTLNRVATAHASGRSAPFSAAAPAAPARFTPAAGAAINLEITTAVTATTAVTLATILVTPSTVEAGLTIAITGSHFLPGEEVDLKLATTGPIRSSEQLAYVKTDSLGNFTAGAITIPFGTLAGTYRITAIGQSSARQGSAGLQVTSPKATLTVKPAAFAPADTITVQGTHFAAGEAISLSLSTTSGSASVSIGHTVADSAGNFGPYTITVPFGAPAGKLVLVAFGDHSGKQVTAPVQITAPAAVLSSSEHAARPGDAITLTGTHFEPGEVVSIDLVTLSTTTRLGTATATATGTFSLGATMPLNTPDGIVSVVASGAKSHLSSTTQISISALPATLSLGSASVKAGATISVSGTGFIPGETISLRLTGGSLTAFTLISVVASTSGTFAIATLLIPAYVPSGAFTLSAAGQTSGRSAAHTLAVQAPPPAAPILTIIDASHVAGAPFLLSPGAVVQVAGGSFPPGAKVNLTLAGGPGTFLLSTIIVNSVGALGPVGVTIPASVPTGGYTIQAIMVGKVVASISATIAALSPHMALSVGTLVPGATVTVRGSGFALDEQVVLALNGAALQTTPATILAGSTGAFSVSFVVPYSVINGANLIVASGVSSRASVSAGIMANLPVASHWYFANGDTTGTNSTIISMLNPGNAPARVTMTFLYQDGPERVYTQTVPPHSTASVGLGLVAGYGRHIATIVQADRRISAESTVTYGSGDSATALGASGPARTWYLAEGYTNGSFTEQVAIMNPSTTFATIDVHFLPFNNLPAREARFVMQPRSNITIDAGQFMPRQSMSVIVTANTDVVVERSMRFGAGSRAAHDAVGVTTASTVWLFAQGDSSSSQQTYFTVLNPNQAAPAAVTATFFDSTGKPVGARTIIVNPLRRGNIKLNDVLPNAHVATVLTSNVPVVVERPTYNGTANLTLATAGSVLFGSNSGGLSWSFPGGSTAQGTSSRIFLFNPGLKVATVHATFYTDSGATVTQDFTLPPYSDTVLNVATIAGLPAGAYGALFSSTNGQVFLAEQSALN